MGISPGFGAACSFVAAGLTIAALASSRWITGTYENDSFEMGVSRACAVVEGSQACNFYFVSVAVFADQPWGWPTSSWKVALPLMSTAVVTSLAAWIVGSLASCFHCIFCVSIPLSAIGAVLSTCSFGLLLAGILKFCGAVHQPQWSMFVKDGPETPVCGVESAAYRFGECGHGWGLWVAVAACALAFAAILLFFPSYCSTIRKTKLRHGNV